MWRENIWNIKWLGRTVLAAAIAAPMVMSVPATASAGNGWSPGAAAVVGVIGGLALGSALSGHRQPYGYYDEPYYPRGRIAYYPPPSFYYDDEPSCYRVRERVWVRGYGWDYRRRTVCE